MIILLSQEHPVAGESAVVQALFERGLPLFHIRKYRLADSEMVAYVNRIDLAYRKQLVLHSHFHLAGNLGIERLHIRELDRQQGRVRRETKSGNFRLSTSVHSIAAFNDLDDRWDYAFLSPVFPSISKVGYGTDRTVLQELPLRRKSAVRLVGLGGIDESNYKQVLAAGADGVAVLGAVWNRQQPIAVWDNLYKSEFRCY